MVCRAGSMKQYGVRLSVHLSLCPSMHSSKGQQPRCCRFAAVGSAKRWYQSTAAAGACSRQTWSVPCCQCTTHTHTRTHTRLTALFPGLPGWAGTRKVKPIWILLKQETVSGSGISWAIRKSAPCSRQITMPALSFLQAGCLPAAQPTATKHWRQISVQQIDSKTKTCLNWRPQR